MKMSLAQRLDSKISWNWFLIFFPIWAFDTILILMLIVKMAGRCKPDFDPRDGDQSVKRRLWYLTALLLKLAFCVTLCSRLERLTDVWVSVVWCPSVVLLGGAFQDSLLARINPFHYFST
uniref:Transmembrane protein 60 n=1 Tax=Gouania willdenowi TaxID=441366 RepID=A0A8C5DS27_GOUWI